MSAIQIWWIMFAAFIISGLSFLLLVLIHSIRMLQKTRAAHTGK